MRLICTLAPANTRPRTRFYLKVDSAGWQILKQVRDLSQILKSPSDKLTISVIKIVVIFVFVATSKPIALYRVA